MSYQDKLFSKYYSTHYCNLIPKTRAEWDLAISRLELNFGEIFRDMPKDSRILDVPCGVGYMEYYLTGKGFTNLLAVDISAEQVACAKETISKWGVDASGKAEFRTADAVSCLKSGDNYDAIVIIDFLEHLEKNQILEMLELAFSSLKKGGALIIRTSNADNPAWGGVFHRDFTHTTPFTPESMRQCLNVTGFDILKIDYEAVPVFKRSSLDIGAVCKRFIKKAGLSVAGKFLGISSDAFSEALVAVAKKS